MMAFFCHKYDMDYLLLWIFLQQSSSSILTEGDHVNIASSWFWHGRVKFKGPAETHEPL